MRDRHPAMALPPSLNPQRLHATGELGVDGDVRGAGSLAGTAPTHSLARLWPCSAFVCVGAYMCATCLINKLSPGDLNQRPFPGPSSHSVAPCVWFLPTPSSGTSIGQGNRCGLFAWGRTGSKSSFGAVPKSALAAKRVSVQWLHSKRRQLLDIQPDSVVKTTELTARHESVWL